MPVQKTFIMMKPDAVQRGLVGEIISRFERKGLKLIGCKMVNLTDDMLKAHYAHIADKPFFPGIVTFMKSTPVVMTAWEGLDCVEAVREMCGITKAREAKAGSIRGDFAMSIQCNLVHASDTPENGEAEVARMFQPEELYSYGKRADEDIYSADER